MNLLREVPDCIIFKAVISLLLCTLALSSLTAQDIDQMRNAEPVKIYGSLGAGGWIYKARGIPNRMQTLSWFLNGSPTLSIYGVTLPFTFSFSEQERRFSQPFNQWGVSPHYKWVTLQAGYRNLRYSEFTLNGHTIFGTGVDINPGKFRFSAVYGRLKQAVLAPNDDEVDFASLYPPSYRRMGYSVKIGVGSRVNFVDIILFKAKDITASNILPEDSFPIKPESNVVLAIRTGAKVLSKCYVDLEAALSSHTRNSMLGVVDHSSELGKRVIKFLDYNGSSAAGYALLGGVSYGMKAGSLRLQYRRVERHFASFGQFFINTDLEQITFAPSFRLWSGKINVHGSIGGMRDNLDRRKAVVTTRTIGSLNVMVQLSRTFNAGFQYSNYGTTQQKEQIIFNDSLLVSLVNQSLGFFGAYILTNNGRQKTFNINGFYNDFFDRNEFNKLFTRSKSYSFRASMFDQWLLSGWNYTGGISVNHFENQVFKTFLLGPNFGLGFTPPKNKFFARANATLQSNTGESQSGYLITGALNSAYQVTKRHGLQLNGVFTFNKTGLESISRFNETRLFFTYTYRFGS
jgi:hypothetical protein